MKKIICSFADKKYQKSIELLEKTAYEIGKVDKVYTYNREWLETTEFYKKNQYILDKPRGRGYWLWKPFIILETFKSLEEGDIVLYSDAGLSVIDNLNPLFEIVQTSSEYGRMLFKIPGPHKNKNWTKRDCFILTDCDEEKYYNGTLTNGALSLWTKNEANIEYLGKYLRYLRDPRIVTDDHNVCGKPNLLEFKDHRHDQSVLSLLTIKNNITLYRDPTQWGEEEKNLFTNSPYNQLFNHHRGTL